MEISKVLALAVYVRDELLNAGCEITRTFADGKQLSPDSVSIDFCKDNIKYEIVLFGDYMLTVEVGCSIIIDKLPDVKKLTEEDTIVVRDSEFVLHRHTYIESARYTAAFNGSSFLITKPLVNDILKLSEI
jgi:hypothetical protein